MYFLTLHNKQVKNALACNLKKRAMSPIPMVCTICNPFDLQPNHW